MSSASHGLPAASRVVRDGRIRKGRGATGDVAGRYATSISEVVDDGWGTDPERLPERLPTTVLPDAARRIITRNRSPDVPFDRSINPYKGCEHGCIYCFARPTHAWLDLSPGLDFETRLFFRSGAAERLREELAVPGYRPATIAMGTNTDPYQPVERELRVTRSVIEVLHATRHPLSIVTKGTLLDRDVDLLADMARDDLVHVMISITTLDPSLKRILEPRAASPARRLALIRSLRVAGIPVGVLVAPVIPRITDHEMESILDAAVDAGAMSAGYILLRLPWEVKTLFVDWLRLHFPERTDHVMSLMNDAHGGRAYDATFGVRQTGRGPVADLIGARFRSAIRRLGLEGARLPQLRTDCFRAPRADSPQLDLFRQVVDDPAAGAGPVPTERG